MICINHNSFLEDTFGYILRNDDNIPGKVPLGNNILFDFAANFFIVHET